MLLINLIVHYMYRKNGVPLHNFLENWTRGINRLKNSYQSSFNKAMTSNDDLLLVFGRIAE